MEGGGASPSRKSIGEWSSTISKSPGGLSTATRAKLWGPDGPVIRLWNRFIPGGSWKRDWSWENRARGDPDEHGLLGIMDGKRPELDLTWRAEKKKEKRANRSDGKKQIQTAKIVETSEQPQFFERGPHSGFPQVRPTGESKAREKYERNQTSNCKERRAQIELKKSKNTERKADDLGGCPATRERVKRVRPKP